MRVVFKSRNGGMRRLRKRERDLLLDLIQFSAAKFLRKDVRKQLRIQVVLDGTLYKNEGSFGTAVWEDTNFKAREFLLEIDSSVPFVSIVNTVAHEMVHVKQWAKGEHWQYLRGEDLHKFHDKKIRTDKVDYWDLPWEIEAHGRAYGIVMQWIDDRKLNDEAWVKKAIDKYAGIS